MQLSVSGMHHTARHLNHKTGASGTAGMSQCTVRVPPETNTSSTLVVCRSPTSSCVLARQIRTLSSNRKNNNTLCLSEENTSCSYWKWPGVSSHASCVRKETIPGTLCFCTENTDVSFCMFSVPWESYVSGLSGKEIGPPIALESVYGLSASVCVRWGVETKKHSRTLTAKLKFSLPLSVCCLHYSKGHFISRGRLVLACLHCVLHTMMFYAVPH